MKHKKKFIIKITSIILMLVIFSTSPPYSRCSESELSSGIECHSMISPHQKNI